MSSEPWRACSTPNGDDQQVRCKEYDPAEAGITVVGSASHMSPLTEEFLGQYTNPSLTQIGSSLKFLLVRDCPSSHDCSYSHDSSYSSDCSYSIPL